MLLDDRKRKILQVIIDDYINTAEPVGSRTLARKHEIGLSSATIRNEMADLEELGLLEQLHTSSGRRPSDEGYRFYVDELLKNKDFYNELSVEEMERIKEAMEIRIDELNGLIRKAASVIANMTNYTAVAVVSGMAKSEIKAVQIVPIEVDRALVIIVTKDGTVKNNMIRLDDEVQPDALIDLSIVFNKMLKGVTIEKINENMLDSIKKVVGDKLPDQLVECILNGVVDCIHQIDNREVYLDGTNNILNFPEFCDIQKAKEFLSLLDAKEMVDNILIENTKSDEDICIQIGKENKSELIRDCSLITTTYGVDGNIIGTIGIIGPKRMEYSRVISIMNWVKKKINEDILKILGDI
ncbi:MAG: heat-inducible transcription repressor HrcA [Clostridiales bacterium]|nr:heat-inducible transcription repressor HrcA [Clostridiales bacterium]